MNLKAQFYSIGIYLISKLFPAEFPQYDKAVTT
jgi:hypothetical protein